jgi:predicted ATP-binding protein involved in virulence
MGGDNIIIPNIMVIHEGDKMRIESLEIQGVGGIKELSLNFNDGLNVICGANGIGKTTILNCINDFFVFSGNIKKNVNSSEGSVVIHGVFDGSWAELKTVVNSSEPAEKNNSMSPIQTQFKNYVLNFGSDRDIKYKKLDNLSGDPSYDYKDRHGIEVSAVDIKNWFVNRFAFVDRPGSVSDEQKENYEIAKNNFSIIDNSVRFKSVNGSTYDIILETKKGDILFEYLSSGYRTCIYIVLGIIKEIEYRFKQDKVSAKDFDGVILIDEIDLHLHPTWQAQLVKALKNIFTKAQIIATTHSPSILQSLNKDEIIALDLDQNGNTFVKELKLGEYGLQGWTLEEILQDVMGMPSTTSEVFKVTMAAFDKAMMEENISEIKKNYELLDKMLHPNSTQRKLLKIQMAGLEE